MLCAECSKQEATVFFKQIVNGKVTQFVLCHDCAQEKGIPVGDPNALFLSLLSGLGAAPPRGARPPAAKCQSCGILFGQFQETGRLGCPDCYSSFQGPLDELLKRVHGSSQHVGKRPPGASTEPIEAPAAPKISGPDLLANLRKALKAAVQKEDFEEAARLRDQIRQAEGKPS